MKKQTAPLPTDRKVIYVRFPPAKPKQKPAGTALAVREDNRPPHKPALRVREMHPDNRPSPIQPCGQKPRGLEPGYLTDPAVVHAHFAALRED